MQLRYYVLLKKNKNKKKIEAKFCNTPFETAAVVVQSFFLFGCKLYRLFEKTKNIRDKFKNIADILFKINYFTSINPQFKSYIRRYSVINHSITDEIQFCF